MAKNKPMTDDEVMSAINAEEEMALGAMQGTIASDRSDALNRYLGNPYGDEIEGRSSVVSRDVSDVVEGVLANVIKPFVSGDEVVRFDPRGPDDEEQAQQETDYINFIALERNNGFTVLSSAIKDALLLRNGYIKAGWTVRSDVISETYQGMTDDEATLIAQDEDVQIVQHSEYPDPAAQMLQQHLQMQQPPMLHDIKVKRVRPTEYVEIDPVPPDEILVSTRTRTASLQDADFVQHRVHKTLSELRQAGYKVDDGIGDDDKGTTIEEYARERFGQSADHWNDETNDPSRKIVLFKETYMRLDRDGDGIAELRRICHVGTNVLADDEAEDIPIASFTGTIMPHQHLGLSIYDMVKDVALIKTALLRNYLDNKYQSVNGRTAVNTNFVNIDDMLVSRPNQLIRVDGNPAESVFPIPSPDTGASSLEGLEYLDSIRENRTGYTRQSAGLDTDALVTNTVGGMAMQLSQSQLRLEIVARTLAETGVRDLFRVVHALTLRHSTRAEKVRLRNKWVTVNPREWARRTDLSINVGLGTASTQQLMGHIMMLGQAQEKVMPLGLATPQNVYNLIKKLPAAAGFKNAEEFFTPPQIGPDGKPIPPPSHPDPAVQVAQIKAQADQQKLQTESQLKQQEMQMQDQIKQRQAAADQAVQQSNDQRDALKIQLQHQLDMQTMRDKLAQQNTEHAREQANSMRIEEMKVMAQVEVARINAGLGNGENMVMATSAAAELRKAVDTLNNNMAADHQGRAALHQVVGQSIQMVHKDMAGRVDNLANGVTQHLNAIHKSIAVNDATKQPAPKKKTTIIRDSQGNVIGAHTDGEPVKMLKRDKRGKAIGVQ